MKAVYKIQEINNLEILMSFISHGTPSWNKKTCENEV